MTFHEIASLIYHKLGPGGGAILFLGAIVLIVELEQLIKHIIKRRKNCPPTDRSCRDK
jgi:hypothetical protein